MFAPFYLRGGENLELIIETLSDRDGCFELIKPESFVDAPVISVVMLGYKQGWSGN